MRPDDFFKQPDPLVPGGKQRLDFERIRHLRGGPIDDADDVEAAVALSRLVHDELEAFGTAGGEVLFENEIREALFALRAVVDRLGIEDFDVPFRSYATFKGYWLKNDGYGSWQARRDILGEIFDGLHDELADLESRALSATLAQPVSPRGRTGWHKIDAEIAELRRHFQRARSPQDYRNVGNDSVTVIEALSRELYDPARHLRKDEEEPPVGNTKQRLGRYVEDALPGSQAGELRRLVRASIEVAQAVKHRETPTRRAAGLAADSVILLANLLRRLDDAETAR